MNTTTKTNLPQSVLSENMSHKVRWSAEELIPQFGIEKYNKAETVRRVYERNFPEMGEFILVPSPYLDMISVISLRTWLKQKEDVGEIIHDKLFG